MRSVPRLWGMGRLREESGQSIVEFAIIAPLLLLLMGGIIDGAWLFHQVQSALHAAANAAQHGAVLATGTGRCVGGPDPVLVAAISEAAKRAAPSLDPSRLVVNVAFVEPACVGRLRTLQVSTSYPLQAFMPYLGALIRGTRYQASTSVTVEMVQVPWSGQWCRSHGVGRIHLPGGDKHHRNGLANRHQRGGVRAHHRGGMPHATPWLLLHRGGVPPRHPGGVHPNLLGGSGAPNPFTGGYSRHTGTVTGWERTVGRTGTRSMYGSTNLCRIEELVCLDTEPRNMSWLGPHTLLQGSCGME